MQIDCIPNYIRFIISCLLVANKILQIKSPLKIYQLQFFFNFLSTFIVSIRIYNRFWIGKFEEKKVWNVWICLNRCLRNYVFFASKSRVLPRFGRLRNHQAEATLLLLEFLNQFHVLPLEQYSVLRFSSFIQQEHSFNIQFFYLKNFIY